MRFVSPVAIGIALALGTASFGVSVPMAAAKEKAGQAPKLKASPGIIPPLQKAQKALNAKDYEAVKAALPEIEAQIKTPDDRYFYYSTVLNLSMGVSDAAMQGEALKGMLDTGLVPAEQVGQFSTIVANNELAAKRYDSALTYAQKAQAAGYNAGEVNPILAQIIWAKAGSDKAEIARGLDLFKQGIDAMKASGKAVPTQWYQVGVSKAAASELPQLGEWAKMAYAADPSGENLRTVLRVFQRNNPSMTNRENLDLLRLMSTSGGLALKPDYLEYAEMAFKGGLFGEVKSAIEKGRAEGVLGSSDGTEYYSVASQRVSGDKASLASAEGDAAKSSTGKIASATADAYMGYGNYQKAIELYQLALQKGSVDSAEVNTRLGISKALAGDTAGARAALAQVNTGSRAGIAKLWIDYLDAKSVPQPAA